MPNKSPVVRAAALLAVLAATSATALLFADEPKAVAATATAASAPVASGPKTPKVRAKLFFIDIDRTIGETEDGLRAQSALKKFNDHQQMTLAAFEDQLKREQDDVAALGQAGDPSVTAKAVSLQKDMQAFNDLTKQVDSRVRYREDELFEPIERRVSLILECIGKSEGIDIVVDKKAMPTPARGELDLTERVIKEYNWPTPGGCASPTPAPAPSASSSAAAAPATSKSVAPPKSTSTGTPLPAF